MSSYRFIVLRGHPFPLKTRNSCFSSYTKVAFPSRPTTISFLYFSMAPWRSCSRPLRTSSSAFRHTFGAFLLRLMEGIRAAWVPRFCAIGSFNGIELFMMPTEFYPNLTATFILVAPWSLLCWHYFYSYLLVIIAVQMCLMWVSHPQSTMSALVWLERCLEGRLVGRPLLSADLFESSDDVVTYSKNWTFSELVFASVDWRNCSPV